MSEMSYPMQVLSKEKEAAGSCQFERYTAKEALFKGLLMFLLTLIAAIVSIVLPGVHFVSVPLGILASPFVGAHFYFSRKGAAKRMSGDFLCPECNGKNHVTAPRILPIYEIKCVHCECGLRLVPSQPEPRPKKG